MDRDGFEAELRRDGYELMDAELEPDRDHPAHSHEFDVRFLVLEGVFTVTLADGAHTYVAGDTCLVPAGTLHAERTGSSGARFAVGTRPAAA
jgi:quercetin dioxygenase-like cupin family protein